MTNYKSDQIQHSRIHGWHVYLAEEKGGRFCKIGTAANPRYRVASLCNGNPRPIVLLRSWKMQREQAFRIERAALEKLAGRISNRDWAKCSRDEAAAAILAALLEAKIEAIEVLNG